MPRSSDLDGVDFRPFFDMMVGVLFVLLILIGALIFFQRTEDGVTGSPEPSELKRWRLQRDRFLERLAGDLGVRGLTARADTAASAVLVSLDGVAKLDGPDLPGPRGPAVSDLAGALAPAVGCVTDDRTPGPACADTDLLSLGALSIQVRLGATQPSAALPRDRAARFLAAALSNALYAKAPSLLRASDRSGGPAVGFEDGTVGNGRDGTPGDLALVFGFDRPER